MKNFVALGLILTMSLTMELTGLQAQTSQPVGERSHTHKSSGHHRWVGLALGIVGGGLLGALISLWATGGESLDDFDTIAISTIAGMAGGGISGYYIGKRMSNKAASERARSSVKKQGKALTGSDFLPKACMENGECDLLSFFQTGASFLRAGAEDSQDNIGSITAAESFE